MSHNIDLERHIFILVTHKYDTVSLGYDLILTYKVKCLTLYILILMETKRIKCKPPGKADNKKTKFGCTNKNPFNIFIFFNSQRFILFFLLLAEMGFHTCDKHIKRQNKDLFSELNSLSVKFLGV